MRVIKRGQLASMRLWEGHCGHCKSKIEAKEYELTIKHDQKDGPTGFGKCPVCGKQMYFDVKR